METSQRKGGVSPAVWGTDILWGTRKLQIFPGLRVTKSWCQGKIYILAGAYRGRECQRPVLAFDGERKKESW